jgi:hypothetical protein
VLPEEAKVKLAGVNVRLPVDVMLVVDSPVATFSGVKLLTPRAALIFARVS